MNFAKISFILAFLGASIFCSTLYAQNEQGSPLKPGFNITRDISSTHQHAFEVDLENGEALVGTLTQNGIDLIIDIVQPDGNLFGQFDSPSGKNGKEIIDFTAGVTGRYSLVIYPLDNEIASGSYTLNISNILSLSENAKRIARKELPTETLYQLWEASLADGHAIETFLKRQSQRHIIEPIEGNNQEMMVTYFCVPPESTDYVMLSGGPDFLGLRFQPLGKTKLWFVTQKVPSDARFDYGFNYFLLDKAGPNSEIVSRSMEHAYDGVVEMPLAPEQKYIAEREQVQKGKLLRTFIQSDILAQDRNITVHTPANYDLSQPHNLVIIFDGEAYGAVNPYKAKIPAPTILDNLLAEEKITPTVTVLVWSMGKRSKDLIDEKFGDFIALELVPWARKQYNITPTADGVVLAGSSRGGFAASFTALRHADIVGKVLSQSGSYWIKGTNNENHWIYPEENGKLIDEYKKSERLPIKFYLDVGLYDAGASMLGMNRQFRDILETKGYEVDYQEFKGGHGYLNWQGTLSDGLMSLIGLEVE